MNKDEALTMCLEYIETDKHERKYVRHAIKAALEQVEPVGEVTSVSDNGFQCEFSQRLAFGTKLYTFPPAAQRKPLTDEQVKELLLIAPVYAPDGVVTRTPFAYRKELLDTALWAFRKAEAAHGIKEGT